VPRQNRGGSTISAAAAGTRQCTARTCRAAAWLRRTTLGE